MKIKEWLRRLAGTGELSWQDIKIPSRMAIERYVAATSEEDKNIPLAIALQVHDAIETKFAERETGKMNSLEMAEVRGGIKALKTFAQIYSQMAFGERQ